MLISGLLRLLQRRIVRSVGMGESGILRFYSRTDGTAYSVRCVKNKED